MTTSTRPTMLTARAVNIHQRAAGTLTPELLARIRDRAPDPTILDEVVPFVWASIISNDEVDSYGTRMDARTLDNFARDADAGVGFLDSHIKTRLPMGWTIMGERTASGVTATAFTIPGLKLGPADSDSWIAGIRAGVIRDVSVGFAPERFECSVCSEDPSSWTSSCLHVPGGTYGKNGKPDPRGERCFAWVRNARLLEVSCVYDGATPGASIASVLRSKIGGALDNGRLAPREAVALTRSANRLVRGQPTPPGSSGRQRDLPGDWSQYAVPGGHAGGRW